MPYCNYFSLATDLKMSVYTALSLNEAQKLVQQYHLEQPIALEAIQAGVTNTNYRLLTANHRYVLTLFEHITSRELNDYLTFILFLHQHRFPCPAPMRTQKGPLFTTCKDKPIAIVSYLAGEEKKVPSLIQCNHAGKIMAQLHLLSEHWPKKITNQRDFFWCKQAAKKLKHCLNKEEQILLEQEIDFLSRMQNDLSQLPQGIIHGDFFKDNVLFEDEKVSGVIDFYYASWAPFIYDLAIAINDWAREQKCAVIDVTKEAALISGYSSLRPLSAIEISYLPIAKKMAALRFWLSRLLDVHFPQSGVLTYQKNPQVFYDLLRFYRSH